MTGHIRSAMRKRLLLIATVVTASLLVAFVALPLQAQVADSTVFINEIHYDNVSGDVGEAIEIAGPAGTDLGTYSIVLYNGNGGAFYNTRALSGTIPDQSNGYGTLSFAYPVDGIQNGSPDGIALVNTTVIQFLSYEGTFTAVGGPASGVTGTDIGVREAGTEPTGLSLQLAGAGDSYTDFAWTAPATNTFGAPNTGQTFTSDPQPSAGASASAEPSASRNSASAEPSASASASAEPSTSAEPSASAQPSPPANACDQPATPIHDVQGASTASPLVNQNVTIQGVVVGDFQAGDGDEFNTDLGGFYLQEEPSEYDTNPLTSEGIFVLAPTTVTVVPGDEVRVTGIAKEFFTLTEVDAVSGVIVACGQATQPPATPVLLPVDSVADFERYEGMLVSLTQALRISEYFNFDQFGEVALCEPNPLDPQTERDRLFQPTAIDEPASPAAAARAEYNEQACITLDDARSVQNPDPARHPNGQVFNLGNRFRGGDIVEGATGILDFRFSLYRIQPTAGATYVAVNPRPEQPPAVGGDLRVASFNVLNYFTTLDAQTIGSICGPSRDQECRGANDAEEFERQRAKIIEALFRIDADIVGLIELENTDNAAIENLLAGLNARYGDPGTYTYIDTGTIGTDAIRVALIYKPSAVSPVGAFKTLTSTVDPRFIDTRNRPALAQTFEQNATGARFTPVVNHLKSKGSECGAPDDDPQQGNCNGTRTQAAEALVDWLATDPTGSGDPDYLIIGDLNAYDKEDPIDEIRAGADDTLGTADDYTDLELKFGGEYAYSYLFDAQFGYLDYALAIQSLVPQVTRAETWHINSDEPDILDYDTSFKKPAQDALYAPDPFRSSDHDPVLVGLDLTGAQTGGRATGEGSIELENGIGRFDLNVRRAQASGTIRGEVRFYHRASGVHLRSVAISSFTVSANTAKIEGTCVRNGQPCTFRVTVVDNGEPGRDNDLFRISINNDPADGGRLRRGNIQVRR